MTLKTKCFAVWAMIFAFAGTAFAQAESGAAAPAPAAGSAAVAPADPAAAVPTAAAPSAQATDARKSCTAAMTADPQFAKEIVRIADERAAMERDADTLAAHVDANTHVQKNQRHVLYAYAAMWLVAAGFVIFLWGRQQALKREIANLRRDLDAAAADEPGAAKASS